MRGNLNLEVAVAPVLNRLRRLHPEQRVHVADEMWKQLLAIQAEVAEARRSGIQDLRASGMTLATIGEMFGLSTSRVQQLERGTGVPAK